MKQTIQLRPQNWIQIQQTRETKALPKFTTPKLKNHAQVYYSFNEWLICMKFAGLGVFVNWHIILHFTEEWPSD